MLVVSRKLKQRIIFQTSDGPIAVELLAQKGNRISVGIDAPSTVPVLREELLGRPPIAAHAENRTGQEKPNPVA